MLAVKSKKGFTLIELIIVIAILAILAAIAIPRLSGFAELAREATDEASAAAMGRAAEAYMEAEQLVTVPAFASLPISLFDTGFTFRSLKYGGPGRNAAPVLGGTVDAVTVSGNGNQVYPN